MNAAECHRQIADDFSKRAAGVGDWSVPTPVDSWLARDVVLHLLQWFPGFLAAGGVDLATESPTDADLVAAWGRHCAAVQALLESPRAAQDFTHPYLGTEPLSEAIDRIYTSDVFMHTWDLARATGQDDRLDPQYCADLLAGMRTVEQSLRDSGHYGPAVPVPADAPVQDQLMGFIGRDPIWSPPR